MKKLLLAAVCGLVWFSSAQALRYMPPEERPELPAAAEIPYDCQTWYDGCNTCGVQDGALTFCTRMACAPSQTQTPYCKAYVEEENAKPIQVQPVEPNMDWPEDCSVWFDGCNTCRILSGGEAACTEMACFVAAPSRCLEYADNEVFVSPFGEDRSVSDEVEVTLEPSRVLDFPVELVEVVPEIVIETSPEPAVVTPVVLVQAPSEETHKPQKDTGQFVLPHDVTSAPTTPEFELEIEVKKEPRSGLWSFIKDLFGW